MHVINLSSIISQTISFKYILYRYYSIDVLIFSWWFIKLLQVFFSCIYCKLNIVGAYEFKIDSFISIWDVQIFWRHRLHTDEISTRIQINYRQQRYLSATEIKHLNSVLSMILADTCINRSKTLNLSIYRSKHYPHHFLFWKGGRGLMIWTLFIHS